MSKVTEYLADRELEFLAMDHRLAATAMDEARALHLAPAEVVKTVLVNTVRGHALVVIPAACRLDMRFLREVVGDPHARLSTEDEMGRDFPEYEPGTLPPLASLVGIPIYVDPTVMAHDMIVFAAGRQTESVRMHSADLACGTVTVASLVRFPVSFDEDWIE